MSSIKLLGIIGAGQMGSGIAQVACTIAKLPILLCDNNKEFLLKQIAKIDANLKKSVAKGRLHDGDRHEAINRIKAVETIEELQECDFVIEAVTESFEVKSKVLGSLRLRPSTIVASNTSSIPISRLATAFESSEHSTGCTSANFIGMHFMNPVPQMRLVEVITGDRTSEETFKITKELAERMGKTVTRSKDVPGFIANRLLIPYLNEAIFALHEGVGTKEDIDQTMMLGTGVPMGPLALADLVGLDIVLAIAKVMEEEFGDAKYRPCPLLIKYVDAGWLGRKTGKGFYEYQIKEEGSV